MPKTEENVNLNLTDTLLLLLIAFLPIKKYSIIEKPTFPSIQTIIFCCQPPNIGYYE